MSAASGLPVASGVSLLCALAPSPSFLRTWSTLKGPALCPNCNGHWTYFVSSEASCSKDGPCFCLECWGFRPAPTHPLVCRGWTQGLVEADDTLLAEPQPKTSNGCFKTPVLKHIPRSYKPTPRVICSLKETEMSNMRFQ